MTDPFAAEAPPKAAQGDAIWRDLLPPAAHWSMMVKRGHILRFTDIEGGGNLAMLLYNPANLLERYNMPDTLKGQHTFYLTRGHCLYTDMGRVIASVVDDTVGWHDTVSGDTDHASVAAKWGDLSYQDAHNDRNQNGRDSFLTELGKYGLGKRDLAANLNWFSKVGVDEDGNMRFAENHSSAGAHVSLRFEMDALVVMHSCPHPMNPAALYPRKPIGFELFKAKPVEADDACRLSRPENARAFMNTALFHMEKPLGD